MLEEDFYFIFISLLKLNESAWHKSKKADILACKAVFCPTTTFKKRDIDSRGFSTKWNLISASGTPSRDSHSKRSNGRPRNLWL